MILQLERAAVERLRQALHPLPVDALPVRGYRFTHAKAAAVVLASDLTAADPDDIGAAVQAARLTLEVALFARSLRDGAGVWDLFEATRRALHSQRLVLGATPLRLLDARLQEGEGDAWTLLTRWASTLPLIPDLEYEGGPLLVQAIFEGT